MNNKGQVLVLFVILLPAILLALIIGIDLINLNVEKQKTSNVIRETINYGLRNYSDSTLEEVNNLIDKNISYDFKNIFVTEQEIKVSIVQNRKLFGRNIELKYTYNGIKENEKIIISEG